MRHLLLAAMLLTMGSASAQTTVFKCVADGGKVTFQDHQDHPCDEKGAGQCQSYAASPILAQGGAMEHYAALITMVDKERAQRVAAAAAAKAAAADQARAQAASDSDEEPRKLCDSGNDADTAMLTDPSAAVDCDEEVARRAGQTTAAAVIGAPGRRH